MAEITKLTDDNFEQEVVRSETPVLVDFWAEWCGPCKAIAPILEELAGEYEGRLRIAKYNVDDSSEYAMKHGIRGIPTLILFKNGEVALQLVGMRSKEDLVKEIEKAL